MIWGILIAIVVVIAIVGWLLAIRYYRAQKEILPLNESIADQNKKWQKENEQLTRDKQELERDYKDTQTHLAALREAVQAQSNILQSLTLTAETETKRAKERAQQEYETAAAALKVDYDKLVAEYDVKKQRQAETLANHLAINQNEINRQEEKIKLLKKVQDSYLKAQQEEQEMREKENYYRIVLSEKDIADMKLLKNLTVQISRPEAVDKLIWELYVKPAYDILMSHLFTSNDKVCGIYKITDRKTKQAYIGQSVDCKERFRQHVKSALSSAPATNKLYQAMKTDGIENFTFQLIETIPKEKLNEREVFWIDFYHTKEFGLNKTAGGS